MGIDHDHWEWAVLDIQKGDTKYYVCVKCQRPLVYEVGKHAAARKARKIRQPTGTKARVIQDHSGSSIGNPVVKQANVVGKFQ